MDRKIKTALITVGILICFLVQAGNNHTLFLKGNKAYRAGNIQEALTWYHKIDKKGPGVWLNMGNCFFSLKDFSPAMLCWKRAMLRAPYSLFLMLEHQIMKLNNVLGKTEHDTGLMHSLKRWALLIPAFYLQIIFLMCWYLLWFFIISGRRPRLFSLISLLLLCFSLLTGIILLIQYYTHIYKSGVVVKESPLLSGPHERYHSVGLLTSLEDVQIKEGRQGWYKVAAHNKTGWVAAEAIEKV